MLRPKLSHDANCAVAALGVGALMLAIPASAVALAAGQALASPAPQSASDPYAVAARSRTDSDVGRARARRPPRTRARPSCSSSHAGRRPRLEPARLDDRRRTGRVQADRTRCGAPARSGWSMTLRRVADAVRAPDGSTAWRERDQQRRAGRTSQPLMRVPTRQSAFSAAKRSTFAGGCCRPFRVARSVSRAAERCVAHARHRAHRLRAVVRAALRRGRPGQARLRVRFGGDRLNARVDRDAGQMTVYRQAGASWYNDGGNTACGFHAQYGVANRSLPCGTKVVFRYGGRAVTATVDDRGPYVGGRDWDLNQNTAARPRVRRRRRRSGPASSAARARTPHACGGPAWLVTSGAS